jgi:hypothetical protein
MRIRVKSGETNVRIWFPTGLVFNRVTVWLADKVGRKYAGDAMPQISEKDMNKLFAEFRRIKRTYGRWTLVEVESADGSGVLVEL